MRKSVLNSFLLLIAIAFTVACTKNEPVETTEKTKPDALGFTTPCTWNSDCEQQYNNCWKIDPNHSAPGEVGVNSNCNPFCWDWISSCVGQTVSGGCLSVPTGQPPFGGTNGIDTFDFPCIHPPGCDPQCAEGFSINGQVINLTQQNSDINLGPSDCCGEGFDLVLKYTYYGLPGDLTNKCNHLFEVVCRERPE